MAIGDGAGVASFSSSAPALINSIFRNGGDEVFVNSATAEVTFSAVQGGYPGQGNIDEDPMFVDPELSDYRLSMGSPCIDSGSSGAVLRLGPSVLAMGDHLGRMRIWDGDSDGFAVVDMGAYEFGPPPFVGDVFGDARVNHLDLFRFQQVWKEEGEGVLPEADQDGDRTIGAADLVVLLHAWGSVTGP